MIDVSGLFPLPFTCQHERFIDTSDRSGHGNAAPDWAKPVAVACCYWPTMTGEPSSPPTGGNLASVDLTLVVDSALGVGHQDRFTVEGLQFEVVGLPKDFDHGPFGYQTHRKVLELRWTG